MSIKMRLSRRAVSNLVVGTLLAVALLIQGCASPTKQSPPAPAAPQSATTAPEKAVDVKLTFGTGPTGSTMYVFGSGWARLIGQRVSGLSINIEASTGAVANTQLIEMKKAELGMTFDFTASEAWDGLDWAQGIKYQRQRVLFPVLVNYVHIITLENYSIDSVDGFSGKTVGVGPAGSGAEIISRRILDAVGVKPKTIVPGSQTQNVGLLKDGQSVATCHLWGIPSAAMDDLAATHKPKLVSLRDSDVQAFQAKYPYHPIGQIPANTYKNQTQPVTTATCWNYVICDKDLPEDLVYSIMKATFADPEDLVAIHAAARDCKPENIKESPIVLHPGAVKFYKEVGVPIPEKLMPPAQ